MRLWRNDPSVNGCKYLVVRRDNTIPEWPWFVLGALDPAAPAGLRAYADKAEELLMDPAYVADIRAMADEWEAMSAADQGDPDAPPHRADDPHVLVRMAEHEALMQSRSERG